MECRHAIIVDGKCVDCGAQVKDKNGANKAAVSQIEQQTTAVEPPKTAQETPKKTTRKRKA